MSERGWKPEIVKIEDIAETRETVIKTIQDEMYDRYHGKLTFIISEPKTSGGAKIRIRINYSPRKFGENADTEQPKDLMLELVAGHILHRISQRNVDREKINISVEYPKEDDIRYIDFVVTENRQIS